MTKKLGWGSKGTRRSGGFVRRATLALALAASMGTLGCAAESDALEDVQPAEDDFTSVSALVGDYDKGRGVFASLRLVQETVNGARKNRFEAEQIEQCAESSCPRLPVRGSWYARGGRVTFYYEGGDRLTTAVTLENEVLTLKNERGTVVSVLERKPARLSGVDELLAKYDLTDITVKIAQAEVDAHGTPTVDFLSGLDRALDLLVHDEDGGFPSVLSEYQDLNEYCADPSSVSPFEPAAQWCVSNRSSTSLRLIALDDDTPPYGDDPNTNWIFVAFLDFSDHGYFAVIPKDGSTDELYVYSFN